MLTLCQVENVTDSPPMHTGPYLYSSYLHYYIPMAIPVAAVSPSCSAVSEIVITKPSK